MTRTAHLTTAALLLATAAMAQQFPDGPGKAELEKLCTGCHDMSISVALRQNRAGWTETVDKMVGFGVQGTSEELKTLLDYLAKHYPAGEIPPLNVNKAEAIDLEAGLTLLRSQARLIIKYREEHGPFRSLEDLKKVPGVDVAKIEAKKDRLVFLMTQ
jgi:competence protein ComEA